jgi:cytosine/adenosine deaminase-related metal-dependent hydrolase
MIRTIHRAQFVLAEADFLLQDAAVHVCDPGRISRVEPSHIKSWGPGVRIIDWGRAIIMPGLVNSHTHLELSLLAGRTPKATSFVDWLSQVVEERRKWTPQQYAESVRSGVAMALRSGTTLVADISASGLSRQALVSERIRKAVFEEAVALAPERAAESVAEVERRLQDSEPDSLTILGVSPHAPYSVSPKLYRELAALARRRGILLTTHAAETREELEFLESGTGPFGGFLGSLGTLPEGWAPPKLDPIPYLEVLGILEQSPLLVHCNYLDAHSMAIIQRTRSSIAFCPRSHAYFGHENHPVRQCLDLGINVALGTDSLASNASLSMLDEMRFLGRSRRDLKCEEIFRMATLNGATALNLGRVLGRVRRGYWADMTVLRLPEEAGGRNLLSQILEGAGECVATIVKGEIVWQRDEHIGSSATAAYPAFGGRDRLVRPASGEMGRV